MTSFLSQIVLVLAEPYQNGKKIKDPHFAKATRGQAPN
jgi:hypothetical protein